MKQLLIVKSSSALNGSKTNAKDLSSMTAGSIGFFNLSDYTWLSAAPTENFGIALGRGTSMPFIIPEVDVNSLTINKTEYNNGKVFTGTVTIPTVSAGKTYTLVLVKLGTGINGERNKWTQSVTVKPGDTSTTAAKVADRLRKDFKAMADAGSIDVTVNGTSTTVTITGVNKGDEWILKAGDDLYGATVTNTLAEPVIGDKAYVEKLARECRGNKGFMHADAKAPYELYPGYPEEVENGVNYNIFNLRFATGRAAGKQTDERIYQTIYIAVPSTALSYNSINKILIQPTLPNEANANT